MKAARDLGYQPNAIARSLRKGQTGTIGVVITDFEYLHNPPVLRGISTQVEGLGLSSLVAESHDSSTGLERALEHLVGHRVDAIIVTASRLGDEEIVARAAQLLPVVLAIRTLPGTRLPTIAHDDFEGGLLAGRHLVSLGHRAIAEVSGAHDVSSFADRRRGFAAGLREAGIAPARSDLVARAPTVAEGARIAAELVESAAGVPSAVFAHNDLLAVGLIEGFAHAGLACPQDVSVIGYNDMVLVDHLQPPLTTVRMPWSHLGRLAAQVAVSLLEHPAAPAPRVTLPPELVVRSSCAPPATAEEPLGPGAGSVPAG